MSQTTFGGDVDYSLHGQKYARQRRTDPRIAERVWEALGDAATVVNVGAGSGSYEPLDRWVLAVEPSETMRSQRPSHASPAIQGFAEALPLDDQAVDAAMATVTIHQWSDVRQGLAEMRRVTRGSISILTFDGDALDRFWLAHYAPELIAAERKRYPAIDLVVQLLGGRVDVETIRIPPDCVDGFTEAFYARPEAFLEEGVRRSQSAWTFLEPGIEAKIVERLAADLESGAWDTRFGEWKEKPYFEGSLRLIVSRDRPKGESSTHVGSH
jgi:hypothetical protein